MTHTVTRRERQALCPVATIVTALAKEPFFGCQPTLIADKCGPAAMGEDKVIYERNRHLRTPLRDSIHIAYVPNRSLGEPLRSFPSCRC